MTLVVSPHGDIQNITTLEQAFYWLRKSWPVTDQHYVCALEYIDAAMHCLVPVTSARNAFLMAAHSAGFIPDSTIDRGLPA